MPTSCGTSDSIESGKPLGLIIGYRNPFSSVPEGHRNLAGGETTGRRAPEIFRPGRGGGHVFPPRDPKPQAGPPLQIRAASWCSGSGDTARGVCRANAACCSIQLLADEIHAAASRPSTRDCATLAAPCCTTRRVFRFGFDTTVPIALEGSAWAVFED